jgi:hypothetical protein
VLCVRSRGVCRVACVAWRVSRGVCCACVRVACVAWRVRSNGQFRAMPGGKGLNQAVALSRLGVKTHLVGCVGYDSMSKVIKEFLGIVSREASLETSYVSQVGAPNEPHQLPHPPRGAQQGGGTREGLAHLVKHAQRAPIESEQGRMGVAVQLISGEDNTKITVSCSGANALVGEREVEAATRLLHGPFRVGMLLLALEVDIWAMRRVASEARRRTRTNGRIARCCRVARMCRTLHVRVGTARTSSVLCRTLHVRVGAARTSSILCAC